MLQVGSFDKVKTVTSNYTCNGYEDVILVNASAGEVTVTLVPSVTGKKIFIKKIDSSFNKVTVSSSLLIDGSANYYIYLQNIFVDLIFSENTFYVVNEPYYEYTYDIQSQVSGTNWSTSFAEATYCKNKSNKHILEFNIAGIFSVATAASSLTVNSMTTIGYNQTFAVAHTDGTDTWGKGVAGQSGSTLTVYAGAVHTVYQLGGRIQIAAKPSWAIYSR